MKAGTIQSRCVDGVAVLDEESEAVNVTVLGSKMERGLEDSSSRLALARLQQQVYNLVKCA